MRKLAVVLIVVALVVPASAIPIVTLVPSSADASRGDIITVSVDLTGSEGFTMTAMSSYIFYDSSVFTYVGNYGEFVDGQYTSHWNEPSSIVQGDLNIGAGGMAHPYTNKLIFSGGGRNIPAGSGTFFTFDLVVNENASFGISELTWGDASFTGVNGFGYGDENYNDAALYSLGTSINIMGGQAGVPEPATATLTLLGLGVLTLIRRKACN